MDFPANLCPVDLCPFNAGANLDGDGDGWADECDNCPLIPNTGQADTDFDGAGNVCDSCPNVFGAIPSPFNAGTVKKAQLGFKNNGPGTSDDSAKTGGAFTTALPFDLDTADGLIVTLSNTTNGAVLSGTSMPGGAPWTQPNPAKLAWKYATVVNPIVKAQVKESPTGSTELQVEGRREECEPARTANSTCDRRHSSDARDAVPELVLRSGVGHLHEHCAEEGRVQAPVAGTVRYSA